MLPAYSFLSTQSPLSLREDHPKSMGVGSLVDSWCYAMLPFRGQHLCLPLLTRIPLAQEKRLQGNTWMYGTHGILTGTLPIRYSSVSTPGSCPVTERFAITGTIGRTSHLVPPEDYGDSPKDAPRSTPERVADILSSGTEPHRTGSHSDLFHSHRRVSHRRHTLHPFSRLSCPCNWHVISHVIEQVFHMPYHKLHGRHPTSYYVEVVMC